MKLLLKYGCILLLTVSIFSACKKEYSCENCLGANQPPVANAGNDTSIVLATDRIILDGTNSSDPDNNISSYQWMKISGPASMQLDDANAAKTLLSNLAEGAYTLELTVTDSGNLSDKDTVIITVESAGTVIDSSIAICSGSLSVAEHLPAQGAVTFTAAGGSKILYIRSTGIVDIYDTLTHRWESKSGLNALAHYLPEQMSVKLGKVSTKLIFSAPVDVLDSTKGQVINIYDFISNTWTKSYLSQARSFYAMAVVGNKVYYAGGNNGSQKMDVYDASTNSWSIMDFKAARRSGMIAISSGNKIFFAGGNDVRYDSLVLQCDDLGNNCNYYPAWVASKRVDILDVTTNTWSVQYLSEARGSMATAILKNKLVFAGSENTTIDFYDTSTGTWSSHNLGPGNMMTADYNIFTINDKLLIPLGAYSNKIHIYDNSSNSWSVALMPNNFKGDMLDRGKVVTLGNKMLFISQYSDIDIYDASNNTWCHSQFNLGYGLARTGLVIAGKHIYIAGGITMTNCCANDGETDKILEFKFD